MSLLVALLLGAGIGAGLWLLAVWMVPPRRPLAQVLATAANPAPPEPLLAPTGEAGWAARWGRPLVPLLRAAGLPTAGVVDDLTVVGREVADHLATKATLALVGLCAPVAFELLLTAADAGFGVGLPVAAGLLAAVVGFLAPDVGVRRAAAARRAEFRHALSAYLDLVVVSLAGGAGVDSALRNSVGVGQGWAFERLAGALETARLTRTTPWARLRQLGIELGVADLAELAASVSLAGTEGAKVRASLATKAAALRARETSEIETRAQSATERMALPVTALFAAFLIFIGYPALAQVIQSL